MSKTVAEDGTRVRLGKGMRVLNWMMDHWSVMRTTIAAGDVRTVERRYFPIAVLIGVAFGVCLSLLSSIASVIVIFAAGFSAGYAVRSYISHRRRLGFIARGQV